MMGQEGCVRVDDELNKEVFLEEYEMVWTKELRLTESVTVVVGAPHSRTMRVVLGDTLQHAFEFNGLLLDGFTVVNRKTWNTISNTSTIEEDMDIAMCHEVVARNVEGGRWLGEHGSTLGNISGLAEHLDLRHMGVDATDATRKYDRDTVLTRDLVFDVVGKVRVAVTLPPTDPSEVSAADVVRDVLGLVGGHVDGLGAEARTNADGLVDQMDIYVFEDDAAHDIADKVNGLDKGAGCTAGILCKSTGAHVVYDDPSSATRAASAVFALVVLVFTTVLFSSI